MICEHCGKKIKENALTQEPMAFRVNDQGEWRNFCNSRHADLYLFKAYQMPLPIPDLIPCCNTGLPHTQMNETGGVR